MNSCAFELMWSCSRFSEIFSSYLPPSALPVRKRFAQNLLFALAVNALVKPAYILLIDRTVQVRAGSEAYGHYNALFNLATIFGVVLDFGLAQYATRMLTVSPDAVRTEIGPLLRARLFLCGLYAVGVTTAAWVLGFRGDSLLLLGGILGVQALAQTLLFFRACVASLQRFKTDSILSILDRALLIGVMGALLLTVSGAGGFWVPWFVSAQVGCYTAAVILAAIVLWRAAGRKLSLGGSSLAVWRAMRGSFPYALLVFFMAVYTRIDMVLLERLVSAEEAGRYAAAFRLLDVGNMVGLTVAAILLPLFGRMLAEGTPAGAIVRAGVTMLLPLSAAAAAVTLFYGADIMASFYPAASHEGGALRVHMDGRLLRTLMIAFPALSLAAVYSTLLTATGALRGMIAIAAMSAVLNVSVNLLLMPRGGADAAATAATLTQWAAALAFTLVVTRRAGLHYDGGWIARHLLLATILVGAAWAAHWLQIDWRGASAIVLVVAGSAAFALRLVSVTEVRRLMQR